MQQDFRIAFAVEVHPLRHQLGADALEVVELAVVGHQAPDHSWTEWLTGSVAPRSMIERRAWVMPTPLSWIW